MNDFFLHPQGICESASIGPGTRIGAFAHVLPGAAIGPIATSATTSSSRTTWSSAIASRSSAACSFGMGCGVADDVFIGPNATFTNDKHPRSKQFPSKFAVTTLRRGCSVAPTPRSFRRHAGRGRMGRHRRRRDQGRPPWAIVTGNPARIVGFVGAEDAPASRKRKAPAATARSAQRG